MSLLFIISPLYAASLRVSPAMVTLQNIQKGKIVDLYQETGVRFTIFNDDEISRTWQLNVYPPAVRGQKNDHYKDILNAEWCWLDKNVVTIKPKSYEYVYLFIQLPDQSLDNQELNNQKWMAVIGIDGQSGNTGISLAADLFLFIETYSNHLSITKGGFNND